MTTEKPFEKAIREAAEREVITCLLEKHYGKGNAIYKCVHEIHKLIIDESKKYATECCKATLEKAKDKVDAVTFEDWGIDGVKVSV